MANQERGEVALTIAGKSYTLVMNTNAMIALQGVFSKPGALVKLDAIMAAIMDESVEHIRAFFWAALQKHHPEIATIDQASEWMDEAGGLIGLGRLIAEVNSAAAPDAADARELSTGTNPQKAQPKRRGTGDGFISRRAKSA